MNAAPGVWGGLDSTREEVKHLCVTETSNPDFILGPMCCNREMQVADCSIVLSLPFSLVSQICVLLLVFFLMILSVTQIWACVRHSGFECGQRVH